jgi:hypothetical protein
LDKLFDREAKLRNDVLKRFVQAMRVYTCKMFQAFLLKRREYILRVETVEFLYKCKPIERIAIHCSQYPRHTLITIHFYTSSLIVSARNVLTKNQSRVMSYFSTSNFDTFIFLYFYIFVFLYFYTFIQILTSIPRICYYNIVGGLSFCTYT